MVVLYNKDYSYIFPGTNTDMDQTSETKYTLLQFPQFWFIYEVSFV